MQQVWKRLRCHTTNGFGGFLLFLRALDPPWPQNVSLVRLTVIQLFKPCGQRLTSVGGFSPIYCFHNQGSGGGGEQNRHARRHGGFCFCPCHKFHCSFDES